MVLSSLFLSLFHLLFAGNDVDGESRSGGSDGGG